MKQANTERPSARPAGEGFKVAKHPFGIVSTLLGKDQNGDHEGNDTGECPENSSSLSAELAIRPSPRFIKQGWMKDKTIISPAFEPTIKGKKRRRKRKSWETYI